MQPKLKIYYNVVAYAKTIALVRAHDTEVAWNMVIEPYCDGYKVYDIIVYPQQASAGYVHVDLAKWSKWRDALADYKPGYEQNMFGQGHSHVNMPVFISGTDMNNQQNEIAMKNSGFYLFQIWNKCGDVNTTFYDVDKNEIYYNDDIEILIDYTSKFVEDSFKIVEKKNTIIEDGVEINEFSEVV